MQLLSSLLCLSLLLFHFPFLMGRGRGSGGRSSGGRSSGGKSSGVLSSNSNKIHKHNTNTNKQGSTSQGGHTTDTTQNKQGGNPAGLPRQQGGGYHYSYAGRGSPYEGSEGYPGRYINANPNNKILSPRYGGSLGYGGYGSKGGSPFSHSVQNMGYSANKDSRGFGRRAVVAAGGGAVVGMALGYGLGRFLQPDFRFRNPKEEYYYNHYMHRKYGTRSTDTNDYSRDYYYSPRPQRYDSYMDSCMRRTDLLPAETGEPKNKPTGITPNGAIVPLTRNRGSNTTKTNSSQAESLPTITPSGPSAQGFSSAEEDHTVSIVEIGYPALIEQLKVRKCLELYIDYSDKYLRKTGGAPRLSLGGPGLLTIAFGTTLMVINSNMIMFLH